jgi:pimeloyl-ACP methyl ester carboxylesterase
VIPRLLSSFLLTLSLAGAGAVENPSPAPGDPLPFILAGRQLAAISPDGRHAAWSHPEGHAILVTVLNLESGERLTKTLAEADDYQLFGTRFRYPARLRTLDWANNETLLYDVNGDTFIAWTPSTDTEVELAPMPGMSRRANERQGYRMSRLLLDRKLDEPDVLLFELDFARTQLAGGTYAQERKRGTFLIQLSTGRLSQLSDQSRWNGGHIPHYDRQGQPRGGSRFVKEGNYEYFLWDEEKKARVPLENALPPDAIRHHRLNFNWVDAFADRAVPLGFGYDPEVFLFTSSAERDTQALFLAHLGTGEILGPVAESERFDLVDPMLRSARFPLVFDEYRRQLAGFRYEDVKPRTVWFDDELSAIQKALDAAQPEGVNHLVAWDEARTRFLVRVEQAQDPGSLFLFDRPRGELALLARGEGRGSGRCLPLWVKNAEGDEILCYLTLPPEARPGEPLDLIVRLHGGPWSRDSWGFDPVNQYLASEGFAILQVNFRGSSGLGKDHLLGAEQRFGEAACDDVRAALAWAFENRLAEPGRVGVMGGSYGGYLALLVAARYPELIKGVVATAPVTDLPRLFEEAIERNSWETRRYLERMIGHPRRDRDRIRAQSPFHLTDQIRCPVLLLHGRKDFVVDYTHSDYLATRLRRTNPEVQIILYEDQGHGGWAPEVATGQLTETVRFFRRALSPPKGD